MTIRFLKSWGGYYEGQIVSTIGGVEETRLIGLGYATYDLDGEASNLIDAKLKTDANGNVTGVVDPSGGILSLGELLIGSESNPYDVVVYGASSSGVIAANAAAEQGMSVLLVSQDKYIGGMTSGGLGACDGPAPTTNSRSLFVGKADAFYRNVGKKYVGSQQKFYKGYGGGVSYGAEPKVLLSEFNRILKEYKIDLVLDSDIISLTKTGTVINSVDFVGIGKVYARQFIDSTYEGDLLDAAKCSFALGRESNATYGETLNGVQTPVNVPQFSSTNIDPYVIAGDTSSGLLPGVEISVGSPGTADSRVQAFNFRLCMKVGSSIKPTNPSIYNPQLYELLGRDFAGNNALGTLPALYSNIFSPYSLPNNKIDLNNRYALSTDYIGPEVAEYITATKARRKEIRLIVKDYILGLFKFINTDARVPLGLKTSVYSLGFASDEFIDDGGFSPSLYIREGRRLISDNFPVSGKPVLVQSDTQSINPSVTNPICQGYYSLDCHNVSRYVSGGYVVNEGGLGSGSVVTGWLIPYNVLLPKVSECTNLLVTCAVATSHVGYQAIRYEPNFMQFGHVAGVAAARAIVEGVSVQSINYSNLVYSLDFMKTRNTDWMTTDAGIGNAGTIAKTGTWTTSTGYGIGIANVTQSTFSTTTAGNTLVANPTLYDTGYYRVFCKYNAKTGRSINFGVSIIHADGTTVRNLNQSDNGQGGDWDDLGAYFFYSSADQSAYALPTEGVTFTVNAASLTCLLNAVKFVKVEPKT